MFAPAMENAWHFFDLDIIFLFYSVIFLQCLSKFIIRNTQNSVWYKCHYAVDLRITVSTQWRLFQVKLIFVFVLVFFPLHMQNSNYNANINVKDSVTINVPKCTENLSIHSVSFCFLSSALREMRWS